MIHNTAMLVDLSISQWSMRKHDKKISEEVEKQYNAFDAGRYNKVLIAAEQGKEISRILGEARNFHYKNTLPWEDDGKRILPSANYLDYMTKIGKYRNQFENAVSEFMSNYQAYKEDAKHRLNGMFSESDYPSEEELRSKYSFGVFVNPVPHKDDFRVDLGNLETAQIKADIERRVMESQALAVRDLWNRLYDSIHHIIERLSVKDAIFRDSLIGNVMELTQLLPKLNFTNDENLEQMRKEIEQTICTLTPENIRTDAALRNQTSKKAQEIVDKMKGYMG